MESVYVMLIIDSVLYFLIGFYISQIFPGFYGVPKRWNFFLRKSYWCPNRKISVSGRNKFRHLDPNKTSLNLLRFFQTKQRLINSGSTTQSVVELSSKVLQNKEQDRFSRNCSDDIYDQFISPEVVDNAADSSSSSADSASNIKTSTSSFSKEPSYSRICDESNRQVRLNGCTYCNRYTRYCQ